jgi:hypothetical protein
MPNPRARIDYLRALLSRVTPIAIGHVSVIPEDDINEDEPAETPVHEEANDPDDADNHED